MAATARGASAPENLQLKAAFSIRDHGGHAPSKTSQGRDDVFPPRTLEDEGPDIGSDDVLDESRRERGLPFNLLRDLFPHLGNSLSVAPDPAQEATVTSTARVPSGRPSPPPDWVPAFTFIRGSTGGTVATGSAPVPAEELYPPLSAEANPMAIYDRVRQQFMSASFNSAIRATREHIAGSVRPPTTRIINHSNDVWLNGAGGGDPDVAVEHMLAVGAAVYYFGRRGTTLASQDSAVRGWLYFCETFRFDPWPATEMSLICFAIWSCTRIRPQSIRNYISAIRMRHKEEDIAPPELKELPRLMRVLDGLDWIFKAKVGKRIRLPFTLDVLVKLLQCKARRESALPLDQRPNIYSMDCTFTAAAVYSMAFVGALRPSEIAIRHNSKKGYTSHALRLRDLQVFMKDDLPVSLILWLPSRKTEQLGDKCDVAMGRTGHEYVCAVQRIFEYLQVRKALGDPLIEDDFLFP